MSYSLVKINTFYPDYLRDYIRRFPEIGKKSYREQYENLVSDAFAWANYFQLHLANLGIDAHEIYENVTSLQMAWAAEHGTEAEGEELLLEQLRSYRPDVVFSEYVCFLGPQSLADIRKLVPSIRLMCAHCCAPTDSRMIEGLRAYDLVFTCTPGFVDHFRSLGLNAHLLNHAFEPSNLDVIRKANNLPASEFLFTGSLVAGEGYHSERIRLLEQIIRHGVSPYIYSNVPKTNRARKLLESCGRWGVRQIDRMGLAAQASRFRLVREARSWTLQSESAAYSRTLQRKVKRPIYGITMLRAMAKAKVVFNSHVGCAGQYAGNMRLFEATGCGTCLVTDWKSNLSRLFVPDYEVVTYRSVAECVDKVIWLLGHASERERIAAAGQKRCIGEHSFSNRVGEFHEIVMQHLSR